MDLLAKHGTRLPLEEVAPEQPHSIVLAGAEASKGPADERTFISGTGRSQESGSLSQS